MIRSLIAGVLALFVAFSAHAQTGGGSATDPYIMNEPTDQTILPGNRAIDGYTLVNQTLIGGSKRCILAFFGQSNSAANYQQDSFTPTNASQIYNLNPYNGGLYLAHYPWIGGGGPSAAATGNWVFRYADGLISNGTCDRVVVAPAAISSTFVADWAAGGQMNNRIGAVARRLAAAGFQVSGVFYQQGESDEVAGTSGPVYAASLATVISTIQTAFPNVPIFISQTSYYQGSTSAAITAAQLAVVDSLKIFNLGNSDAVGAGGRWDNIHFNSSGCATWAAIALANSASHLQIH